jgi:steroid delta-isomerase
MTPEAPAVITPDAAAALCDAYLGALVAGDLEAVLALFTPDALVEDPVGSEPQQGQEALRAFYQIACDSVSGAERVGPPRIAGTDIAFAFTITVGSAPDAMCIDIIDVFTCDGDGKVSGMRAYWGPDNMRPAQIAP